MLVILCPGAIKAVLGRSVESKHLSYEPTRPLTHYRVTDGKENYHQGEALDCLIKLFKKGQLNVTVEQEQRC